MAGVYATEQVLVKVPGTPSLVSSQLAALKFPGPRTAAGEVDVAGRVGLGPASVSVTVTCAGRGFVDRDRANVAGQSTKVEVDRWVTTTVSVSVLLAWTAEEASS